MLEEVVIDINVFMSAISTAEAAQGESVAFLRRVGAAVKAGDVQLREPPLFVLEFFTVRNRRKPGHDLNLYPEMMIDPIPTVIEPFTEDDAHGLQDRHKAAFPTEAPYTKRGGDLEYLAVALKHGCTLVSLDSDLLKYGERGFCEVIQPVRWLGPGNHAP